MLTASTYVLVNDIEDPEAAAVAGVTAHEVVGPDVVGMLGSAFPHGVLRAALSVLARRLLFRLFEPFQPPQPPHSLVVDPPPLPSQPPTDRLVALLRMCLGQLVETSDQAPLEGTRVWLMAIGRPMLVDQQARPPLRHPVSPL